MAKRPPSSRVDRARIVLLLLLACLLGGIAWVLSPRTRTPDHWDEVAEPAPISIAVTQTWPFKPSRPFETMAPGAPEGLTLAARALLMRGNITPSRGACWNGR